MQTDDTQRIIRDFPILQWFLGVVFVGVGALVLGAGGPVAFGGLFAAVGLGLLLFSGVATLHADRTTRMLTVKHRSALRRTTTQVPFDEIDGINVERRAGGGKGGSTYRLTVLKKDGRIVPFGSAYSTGWMGKERRAARLREFIGIQDSNRVPSGILPEGLSRPAEVHETDGVRWRSQPMFTAASSVPTGMRWHSENFRTQGGFLFLAQKAEGQSSGGFLASLGSLFVRQALLLHGFAAEDTPGLERAVTLSPLDPSLERHFMAYTNSPGSAREWLNPRAAALLADWAGRHPLNQGREGAGGGQLMTLFGPNGVSLTTLNLTQPDQAQELVALGVELVKSLGDGGGTLPSAR
jgi:hypothetical protein